MMSFPAHAQTNDEVFLIVEQMPEFPGGQEALLKFLHKNLNYPDKTEHWVGRVIVSFIIEKDGSINPEYTKVIKSIGSTTFDKESLRVIHLMPKWNPGKQRGIPVRVRYNLPIQLDP